MASRGGTTPVANFGVISEEEESSLVDSNRRPNQQVQSVVSDFNAGGIRPEYYTVGTGGKMVVNSKKQARTPVLSLNL